MITLLLMVLSTLTFAQSTMPDRVVYASSGRTAIPSTGLTWINNKQITYTIGEPLIYAGLVGTRWIHNGFEQPDKLVPISPTVVMLYKPDVVYKVYPNPMTTYSFIQGPEEPLEAIFIQLMDANGKLVAEYTMASERLQIDFENTLTPGTYFLNFYSKAGQFIQQNKLIKQ